MRTHLVSRSAVSLAIAALALAGCSAETEPQQVEQELTAEPVEPSATDEAVVADDAPVPDETATELLRIPLTSPEGFRADVVVTQWDFVVPDDLTVCEEATFRVPVVTHPVVISGYIEPVEVNGFTWGTNLRILAGTEDAADWLDSEAPVYSPGCISPASSIGSLPTTSPETLLQPQQVQDAQQFTVTFNYASLANPNFPEGRFDEVGQVVNYLYFPHVAGDCSTINQDGFSAEDSGTELGNCTVKRTMTFP